MNIELLLSAVRENNIDLVKIIIASRNVSTEVVDQHGGTLLHYAVWSQVIEICELIINSDPNVNVADSFGQTALHFASEKGTVEICELLIRSGADVNVVSQYIQTPLHLASYANRIELCKLLIRSGADVNSMDGIGNTPLDYATPDLRDIMIKTCEDINSLEAVFNSKNFYDFFTMPISSLLTRCTIYKKTCPGLPPTKDIKKFLDKSIGMEADHIKGYAESLGFTHENLLNEIKFFYDSSYSIFSSIALQEIQEQNIEKVIHKRYEIHSDFLKDKNLIALIFSYLEESDIKKPLTIFTECEVEKEIQDDVLVTGDS